MIDTWDDLEFWKSGEWQWIQEKLDELDRAGTLYNPPRHRLFAAMDALPIRDVRVAIFGQDPYPSRAHSTGIAFSIPEDCVEYPPSLVNIFSELSADIHIDMPTHGNLMDWVKQGVFLWNVYPSCLNGKPGSHHWLEWETLTAEVVKELAPTVGVMVFLGNKAQKFIDYLPQKKATNGKEKIGIPDTECTILKWSHPSPLGYEAGKTPFKGSRMFTTINSYLVKPIDWRLEDGEWYYGRDNARRSPRTKPSDSSKA